MSEFKDEELTSAAPGRFTVDYSVYAALVAERDALRKALDALTTEPLSREQATRIHPSLFETRWANFTDRGPEPWEGFTFMGHQNHGNPFNPDMTCLLWVRLKAARRAALSPEHQREEG